MGEEKMSK
ncbi:hypothetical protein RDI58_011193 [Solanum bulbocastanum]|uniref:Uncharacterized protein n=1 Tax=Solanum bulbocastanum TaxID=147425 RepID=A0AAN8TW08_SOLBU